MIDIDAITADVRTAAREQAAGHMLDAIECVTDDHVRGHASDSWYDLLKGAGPGALDTDDVRARAEAAIKSLTAAIADLTDVDDLIGIRVGEQAMDLLGRRGIGHVEVFYLVGRGWRWTCDMCEATRVLVGPLLDLIGRPNLVDLVAAHVREYCPGETVDR